MLSKRIEDSPSLRVACERFLSDLAEWVGACIGELADAPPLDGHDQGTFTIPWAPAIRAGRSPRALGFLKELRDKTAAHFAATGLWKHGYWTLADVHHGTEHFELFLGALWRLDPDDGVTVGQLVDAAEHMGNWVPGIPAWFDWDTGLFRSMHFGTEGVKAEAGTGTNMPPHLRCASICLLAHAMAGGGRYLDLAALHAGRWADAILAGDELPIGLADTGALYAFERDAEQAYRGFAGQAPALRLAVDRAENFLASAGVDAFLELWRLKNDARFRGAAATLVGVLATQLDDPDAGPAADAVRTWRSRTHDSRFDQAVLDAASRLAPFAFSELAIEPAVPRARRPAGIGKRKDLPAWFEDGAPRRDNPILLGLAAELGGDERLAARAVDLARAYFALARRAFPHGRRHGCSARSVSAVARGHGRNNNAGVVTGVLEPLMAAFGIRGGI